MRSIHVLVASLLLAPPAQAADYQVTRTPDLPFSFTLIGVKMNEGSALTREAVLLNYPGAPVQVENNSIRFDYKDRRLRYNSLTELSVAQPITAIEVRHVLYDVFGRHMKNLSNLEVKDTSPGTIRLTGTWNALRENDASELLTAVTFVSRVRLADGTQWVFDDDALTAALGQLNLEKTIHDDAGDGDE